MVRFLISSHFVHLSNFCILDRDLLLVKDPNRKRLNCVPSREVSCKVPVVVVINAKIEIFLIFDGKPCQGKTVKLIC